MVFVHGTGVREAAFHKTFSQVEGRAKRAFGVDAVVPCYWGTACGTRLRHYGRSIPLYDVTMALEAEPDAETLELALWRMLYDDPLYELRLAAAEPHTAKRLVPGRLPALGTMNDALDGLAGDADVREGVGSCRLDAGWNAAVQHVRSSRPYTEALVNAGGISGALRAAVARALVAEALRRYSAVDSDAGTGWAENDDDTTMPSAAPDVPFDGRARDALCAAIVARLGGATLSPRTTWIAEQLRGAALRWGTTKFRRRRGAVSDAASPGAGDIVRYQARGDELRAFVRDVIATADPPCIVIAHSLGGVVCVDLFAERPIAGVKALITVGSQAPYFYEIDALHSLRWNDPLPQHFPDWINVYDLRDFLSYVGGEVFPKRVVDVEVDSRQPFPESHGAYWANDDFWSRAKQALPH